jgi:UDP-N-acetylmuramate dehydrogenase
VLKNNFTSLKNFNTFGFDIQAENLIVIQSEKELIENFGHHHINDNSRIISGGSNILFTQNVVGTLLKNEIEGIEIVAETDETIDIAFGGGENWHKIVLYCVDKNWGGLENLSLIPGCVGASPIQNIGAYGSEIKDTFQWLKAFNLKTGEFELFNHAQCNFGYRDSYFKNEGKNSYFITQVCFRLSKNPIINVQYGDIQAILDQKGITHPTIKNVSDAVIEIRQSKLPDPKVLGNCGSFFKNPVISLSHFEKIKENHPSIKSFPVSETEIKVPAGWLIEQAGWKGKKVGNVGVHEKQALVLVNYGQGTGIEIKNLAQSIQKDILEKFTISLEIEVNIW